MEKSELIRMLEKNDFQVEEAMLYCANSEAIYREVLLCACQESIEKIPLLQEYLQQDSPENYQIEVHGLKNVAKTIGASKLFEMANRHNELAKVHQWQEIQKEGKALLQMYQETVQVISDALEQ